MAIAPRPVRVPLLVIGASLLAVFVALAATGGPVGAGAPDDDEVRVTRVASATPGGVSLLVTPPRDLSLLDLGPSDITVQDADGEVPAEVVPQLGANLDVAIVVDLGQTEDDARAVLGATDELVRTMPPEARLALVSSATGPSVKVPLGDDRPALLDAVAGLERSDEGDLIDQVVSGVFVLESGTGSRSALIVISPEPVDDAFSLQAVTTEAVSSPAVYVAATGPGSDEVDRVVTGTGGTAVVVDRPEQLIGATDQITSDLGSQYRVDFPKPTSGPTEVSVRVAKAGIEATASIDLADPEPSEPRAPAQEGGDAAAAAGPARAPGQEPDVGSKGPSVVLIGVLAALVGVLIAGVGLVANGTIDVNFGRRGKGDDPEPDPRPARAAAGVPGPARSLAAPAPASIGARPELPPTSAVVPSPAELTSGPPPLADHPPATIGLRAPQETRNGTTIEPGHDGTIDLSTSSRESTEPAPLDADLLSAADRADRALDELRTAMGSLPEGFPLDGFVLREAVASVTHDGAEVSLRDMFRSRCTSDREITPLAPDVERLIEAMAWGLDQATNHHLGRGVLTGLLDRRAPDSRRQALRDRHGDTVPAPSVARSVDAAIDMRGLASPALRAALARQIVATGWPDEASREWLARASVSLSLARDGSLTQPVIDVGVVAPVMALHGSAPERPEAPVRDTLRALAVSSTTTRGRLDDLIGLRASYMDTLANSRPSRAPAAINVMMANPVITAQFVADEIGLSHQGALNLIRRFERDGWLRHDGSAGRGGRKYWIAPDVLSIFAADLPSTPSASPTEPKEQQ